MVSTWRLLLAFGALCSVDARSLGRGPLSYLSTINDATISTPSRRVNAFSSFDLTFSLHDGAQRVRLGLEPNHDIISPDATISVLDSEGNIVTSEPILRHEHLIFKGSAWVWHEGSSYLNGTRGRSPGWTNVGWARITVHHDGARPVFDGGFSVMHNNHHIQLAANYLATKHAEDPDLERPSEDLMVLWRDSDVRRPSLARNTAFHLDLKRRVMDADLSADGFLPAAEERSCSSHKLNFNSDPRHPVYRGMLRQGTTSWGVIPAGSLFGKRQIDTSGIPSGGNSGATNLRSTIGNTAGCPTTRKVASFGVAADCNYFTSFDSNMTATQKNIITQTTLASQLYERNFNVTLGLRNLTVMNSNCPGTPADSTPWNVGCGSGNTSISDRLNLFSKWRGQFKDNNAYWTLMTNCPQGPEVGLSWLGQLCVTDVTEASGESTSGANVVARTSTEWQVFAHETGHMFGAVHDCDSQTCADASVVNAQQCCPQSATTCDAHGQFIMNPSMADGIQDFSPCSVGNICSAFYRNSVRSSCLSDNKNVTTYTGAQCGNGIVEAGEDCDCGGTQNCKGNQCCDPDTCKFRDNAVCDDSNEDCCKDCQLARNGTICRPSTGECDPAEVCSGSSATCPSDRTSPDGQSCGNDGLQCASGQCTSRDLQCKTLMGAYTQKNDTYACNNQDCTLLCASPEFPAGECYSMQQNFLDGTPCGGGGSCSNGVCKGSNVGTEISSWIDDHKALVIGVCSGVGGLLLLSITICIFRRCRTPRRSGSRKLASPAGSQTQWPMHTGGWNGYPQQRPPSMAPTYLGHSYGFGHHNGNSVRYA